MGLIRVETVTRDSVPKLRDLNQKIFPILTDARIKDSFYQKFVSDGEGFALFGYYSDKLAGAVCCQLDENSGLYVRFIGVISRYRRKGVGSVLLKEVLKTADQMGILTVYMFVRQDNKGVCGLARKHGLKHKGETESNLLIMERKIEK